MMMRKDGAVPLLARLIQSDKAQILVPVVGILNHFAKEVFSLVALPVTKCRIESK